MSDPQRDEFHDPQPVRKESHTDASGDAKAMDDRGGFRDTAPNPHNEQGAGESAARAGGAMAGMFFPVVIVAIVAIVVILFFVL